MLAGAMVHNLLYPVDGDVPSKGLGSTPGEKQENPLSVTDINTIVKGIIDDLLPEVWIAGEISDLSRPQSGHIYFSIKDQHSTVRAVMWRNAASRLDFDLKDGQKVVGAGKVDVYVPRGSYQIVFRSLFPVGEGGLQAALRKLHAKLEAEGLFAAERKKPLPEFPQRIGFVTSPSGAAIRDFLEMLRSRWPMANVLVIPASVQGDNAPREIVEGIRAAQKLNPPLDVLVVGRGGGSMEDLWHFNDERVVRAVANCSIPTISAVGHEIDVTLCDLAADVRALTPSDAAIRCTPSQSEILQVLSQLRTRCQANMIKSVEHWQSKLKSLQERPVLSRPEEVLLRKQQSLDETSEQLKRIVSHVLQLKLQQLTTLSTAVEAFNPLGVLARGYSITRRSDNGRIVRSSQELKAGDSIETILHDGKVTSDIRSVN